MEEIREIVTRFALWLVVSLLAFAGLMEIKGLFAEASIIGVLFYGIIALMLMVLSIPALIYSAIVNAFVDDILSTTQFGLPPTEAGVFLTHAIYWGIAIILIWSNSIIRRAGTVLSFIIAAMAGVRLRFTYDETGLSKSEAIRAKEVQRKEQAAELENLIAEKKKLRASVNRFKNSDE